MAQVTWLISGGARIEQNPMFQKTLRDLHQRTPTPRCLSLLLSLSVLLEVYESTSGFPERTSLSK